MNTEEMLDAPEPPRSRETLAHRRPLVEGAALLLVLLGGAPVADAGDLNVHGFAALRGTGVRSQPSWREGAFGRLTLGADAAGDGSVYGLAKLHVAFDWQPSPFFGAYVHLAARAEPGRVDGRALGIVEAFLHAAAPAGRSGSLDFQLGHFILPTSRENVEFAWSSPYTLTFSALNTWIGEEMRLSGLLAEYEAGAGGRHHLRFGASVFGGNDASGALLAWRGWSMGDRLTVFGEVVPLPPLASLQPDGAFAAQRDDGTRPYGDDLDGRAGLAGYLRWRRPGRAVLQLTRLDNRGDRGLHDGEYAWRTELDLLGGELRLHDSLTVAAEILDGSTGMGDAAGRRVQADLEAAYLLASWHPGRWRATLRYDSFETVDVDRSGADDNDEEGDAWTLAVFVEPRRSLRLGLELSRLDAQRPAAAEVGFDPDTGGRSVKLELRYYFDF